MLEQHTQKDISKNELAHVLLIGGTHNKQGLVLKNYNTNDVFLSFFIFIIQII